MADDKDILKELEKLKEHKQFSTPNGYFESFADKLMDKIEVEESREEDTPVLNPSFFSRVSPYFAIAASFTALFILAYTVIAIILPDKPLKLTADEIFVALEEDVHELDEIYMYNLIDPQQEPKTGIENKEIELTEEEIIQYLVDQGEELNMQDLGF